MPEEVSGTINPANSNGDAIRRLERRIESLEYAADRENKWWRGGLIAALVLVALSILIAGHHRHHRPPPGMGGMGMGMMGRGCDGPRSMYGPPPPPPWWANRPGNNWGPPEGYHRHHEWGNFQHPEGPPPAPPKE